MQIHIAPDPDALSHEMADWISRDMEKALRHSDIYTLALSGGSTPERLYRLLAAPPYSGEVNWEQVHFFFGDERYVPFTDERNNGKMAYDTLLSQIPVP